jgi:type IV pilus assembly protein PilE
MKNSLSRGFTLIELMIVVAIVAILASIAYPAYTSSIVKGKRAEGRAALTELMQQQERYLTQRNTYLAFTNSGGVTNPASVPFKTFSGDSATSPAYFLSAGACPSGTATLAITECVRVIATPTRADPAAGNIQLTSTGTKDCSVSGSMVCWK